MKQLLYFTSKLCSPCKGLTPIMDELSQSYNVTKIDVQEQPTITRRYGVRSVPTTVLLEDGEEVERVIGVRPKIYYLEMLE